VRYALGIDQGGTKTAAIIIKADGTILGLGKSKGAYHISDGIDFAMASVSDAANTAARQAGIGIGDIGVIAAGITGMDWPEDYSLLRSSLVRTFGIGDVHVCNDSVIAMYSGTAKKYGMVLCAGTGLNVAVKSPSGEESVFGFYIDDNDQGGSSLGRRAIREVFNSEIGLCKPTKLTELFLHSADVKTVHDLLHRYTVDDELRSKVKDMVPQIIEIANQGDPVAVGVIKKFAFDLSRYIYAGLKKYDMLNLDVDVVLSGSVLKGADNLLTKEIIREVGTFAPKSNIINSRLEPVVGAGLLALMQFGNYETEKADILRNINASAEKFNLIRK
jgi:N-acetylglucosamine kinase-like BadF-type ATPase